MRGAGKPALCYRCRHPCDATDHPREACTENLRNPWYEAEEKQGGGAKKRRATLSEARRKSAGGTASFKNPQLQFPSLATTQRGTHNCGHSPLSQGTTVCRETSTVSDSVHRRVEGCPSPPGRFWAEFFESIPSPGARRRRGTWRLAGRRSLTRC